MVQIKIVVQSRHVTAALSDVAQRQVPFALARTLTAVARDVQEHLKRQLPVAFDRPTPFTQRGVFMKAADKTALTATVFFPSSEDQRGKAQREYIRPGAQGASARNQKKTEYLLTQAGFLPSGWVTVPGTYMSKKLDGYGNMPGIYYRQIIRSLRIKTTRGPARNVAIGSQRRAARMGVENEFFAVTPGANKLGRNGGWLPSGVYRRTGAGGRTLEQWLKFVRRARYKQRLNVKAEAQKSVEQNLDKRFAESVQQIVGKFKPR